MNEIDIMDQIKILVDSKNTAFKSVLKSSKGLYNELTISDFGNKSHYVKILSSSIVSLDKSFGLKVKIFVSLINGDIFKPESFLEPKKESVGNIFNETDINRFKTPDNGDSFYG